MSQQDYSTLGIIALVLVEGAFMYCIDINWGTRFKRWIYGLTHKDSLPEGEEIGFIYKRRAHARFSTALAIAITQSVLALRWGTISPFQAAYWVPLQLVPLMFGFYLGPVANRIWDRRKPLLDTVDQIEHGETTVAEQMKSAMEKLRRFATKSAATSSVERVLRVVKHKTPTSPTPLSTDTTPTTAATETPEPDPEKVIRDFSEGRRRR